MPVKNYYFFLFFCFSYLKVSAQKMKYVYRDAHDTTHNFYVKLIPSVPVKRNIGIKQPGAL